MVIGLGTLLIVLKLMLVLNDVNVDSTAVDTLGWVLLATSVLAIVVSLVATLQRSHITVVEESRHSS